MQWTRRCTKEELSHEDVESGDRHLRGYEGAHACSRAGLVHAGPDEPKVSFTSTESFAKVLSAGNRELLRIIAETAPGSLDELVRITGRAKSNLSRTLKTMAGYGLVRLERDSAAASPPRLFMIGWNWTCL